MPIPDFFITTCFLYYIKIGKSALAPLRLKGFPYMISRWIWCGAFGGRDTSGDSGERSDVGETGDRGLHGSNPHANVRPHARHHI